MRFTILAFYYTGDFLALQAVLFANPHDPVDAEALSNCTVGVVSREVLERAVRDRPEVGQALWQAAMVEASIIRQRLVIARWPALQRVAHLLCEQLARCRGRSSVIPLSQIEVADSVGLSVVHTNRVFQELRKLHVVSRQRILQVVNRERLEQIASFDGGYLNATSAAHWDVRIES